MHSYITSLALLTALALPLAAQEPQCQNIDPQREAACNTMVDATRAFHPLAGMIVSGGNPLLGTGSTLGGFGHLSASLRFNAIKASLPNPDSAARNPVPSSFDGYFPAPVIEAAVGLYRGTGGGLVSIDALGSAVLLPASRVRGMSVDADAPKIGDVALGIGYGARIGILNGSFPVPAVSVSVMKRHVPRVQFGDVSAPTSDPADFSTDFDATNWRAVAGMRILFADVAAGLGIDHYTSAATIHYQDVGGPRTVVLDLKNTRQVLFLNAGLTTGLVKLVGELGYQTGTDQSFSTTFRDFDPKAGHVFWGAGLRLNF
ncbi:MAG TPA: hypothetical protein VGQ06_12245 [Gemmatimonadales bacterium]|jgi:hypothetical protein|nr:hypothetical protein [Gemmatimonadales bacterium]